MKTFSEMNTEELSRAICTMAEKISNIVNDPAAIEALSNMKKLMDNDAPALQTFSVFASDLIPTLLGDAHREDTFAILAAFSGKTVDELKQQNGFKTAKELYSLLMKERDLGSLFRAG